MTLLKRKPMKIQIRTFLIALLLLVLPIAGQAQYICTTNNGAITITGYTGSGGAVVIPVTINGYPVTSIGPNAFVGNNSLTSITIPNSITSIEYGAFNGCYYLTSALLGNGVARIGDGAFSGCPSLTGVIIPNSLTNLGAGVFTGDGLINITVNAANSIYSSLNGVLFDKAQTLLIQFPGGRGGIYVIPNSVTSIGLNAFEYCANLTGVTIGNSVTNIGAYAFDHCYNLGSVINGNGIISIGFSAFANCWSLTSVTIGNNVTSIGASAFYDCENVTNLTVNGNVTDLGYEPFIYCFNLTSVTIGSSVTNINVFSQLDYSSETDVTNITVNVANPVYSSLNGVMFDKTQSALIQFPKARGGTYVIPNSVSNIGTGAFSDCENLTGVIIGNSVISIGDRAFKACSLTNVTIPGSVTNIGMEAFADNYFLTSAYFLGNAPSNDGSAFEATYATVYYLPETTGWGAIYGGVPIVLWNPQAQNAGVTGGRFGFGIIGPTNAVIVVEACTNLSNPVWIPVGTNTLSAGTSAFSDSQSSHFPNRYYRFRSRE
jgi:BspA type Leucine rich repeat region (6 copies)